MLLWNVDKNCRILWTIWLASNWWKCFTFQWLWFLRNSFWCHSSKWSIRNIWFRWQRIRICLYLLENLRREIFRTLFSRVCCVFYDSYYKSEYRSDMSRKNHLKSFITHRWYNAVKWTNLRLTQMIRHVICRRQISWWKWLNFRTFSLFVVCERFDEYLSSRIS